MTATIKNGDKMASIKQFVDQKHLLKRIPPMINVFTCEISRPGVESEIQDMKQA